MCRSSGSSTSSSKTIHTSRYYIISQDDTCYTASCYCLFIRIYIHFFLDNLQATIIQSVFDVRLGSSSLPCRLVLSKKMNTSITLSRIAPTPGVNRRLNEWLSSLLLSLNVVIWVGTKSLGWRTDGCVLQVYLYDESAGQILLLWVDTLEEGSAKKMLVSGAWHKVSLFVR